MTDVSTGRIPRLVHDGYELVLDALSGAHLDRLYAAADRVHRKHADRARDYYAPRRRVLFGVQDLDPEFVEPVALPTVLPIVCSALGWNIYIYHSHLDRNESLPPDVPFPYNWHRDMQGVTYGMAVPLPLLSIKVCYFLTDISAVDSGGPLVIPGSHRDPLTEKPAGPEPPGAVPVLAPAGSALIVDSRLWHTVGANRSGVTRMSLFYAYAYRWIRPLEPSDLSEERLALLSPIQRQFLGAGTTPESFHLPADSEVPLRDLVKSSSWSTPEISAIQGTR